MYTRLLGVLILILMSISPVHADSWKHNFNREINITEQSHYWQKKRNAKKKVIENIRKKRSRASTPRSLNKAAKSKQSYSFDVDDTQKEKIKRYIERKKPITPAPAPAPQVEPKVEPAPAPAPQVEPKVKPAPAPQVEPKVEPAPAPKPAEELVKPPASKFFKPDVVLPQVPDSPFFKPRVLPKEPEVKPVEPKSEVKQEKPLAMLDIPLPIKKPAPPPKKKILEKKSEPKKATHTKKKPKKPKKVAHAKKKESKPKKKRVTERKSAIKRGRNSYSSDLEKFAHALSCVPSDIVAALEEVVSLFGPIKVNSTHRPGARVAGTNRTSYHASCRAVDFNPPKGKYNQVAKYLKKRKGMGAVGTYSCSPHIHIDNGPRRNFHVNKC